MDNETQTVKTQIEKAFPWIVNHKSESIDNHLKWKELRLHLQLLPPDDLLEYLPFILSDLLLTHTDNFIETEGAEFVIMKLNALSSHSDSYYEELSSLLDEDSAKQAIDEDLISRKRNKDDFVLFNKQQAYAVYRWLMLAQAWNDFDIFRDDLEQAIQYWRHRSDTNN